MRIISGSNKGRRITPPGNLPVRPTTDMAKEGLFNILNNLINFEDLRVLDLFAGTGNITFEFASRGALQITSVDLNYKCVDFIRKTSENLNFQHVKSIRADVFKYLGKSKPEPFDLVFSDAPYTIENITELPDLIITNGWLKKNAWLIVEHPRGVDFTRHPYFNQVRNYGRVYFSFFFTD